GRGPRRVHPRAHSVRHRSRRPLSRGGGTGQPRLPTHPGGASPATGRSSPAGGRMSSDRTIVHEIEVPGTPEQVWQAIATGQGITAWFVPTQVQERSGGTIEHDFGPGMGSAIGEVTAWEPP